VAVAGLYRHPRRIVKPWAYRLEYSCVSAYPFQVSAMLTEQDVADYLKQGFQR
jgi:hypothetical protein